jgi:uroporphyrinogen-III decarboxylase
MTAKTGMTSKERLRAALLGEEVDRLPFSPNLAYLFGTLPQAVQEKGHMAYCREVGADLLNRFGPCAVQRILPPKLKVDRFQEGELNVTTYATPVGTVRDGYLKSEDGNTSFLVEHALKSEEDYKVWLWIEENSRFELKRELAEEALEKDRDALLIGMLLPRGKTAFQTLVEQLVGTEELIYALMDFPKTVQALLKIMTAQNLEAVKLSAQAGYEFFLTWEDSSTQNYSPQMYAQYIAPELGSWCGILKTYGKHYIQHACGHVRGLLPQMKRHGILAVESLSPMPTGDVTMAEARAELGSEVGIIGGIEPTELLNRSLAELAPYVEQVISDCSGGPFILANSDSCPPGVTAEKFRLIARIAKEH